MPLKLVNYKQRKLPITRKVHIKDCIIFTWTKINVNLKVGFLFRSSAFREQCSSSIYWILSRHFDLWTFHERGFTVRHLICCTGVVIGMSVGDLANYVSEFIILWINYNHNLRHFYLPSSYTQKKKNLFMFHIGSRYLAQKYNWITVINIHSLKTNFNSDWMNKYFASCLVKSTFRWS